MVLLEYLSELINSLSDKSFADLKKSFKTTRIDKRKRILSILNKVRKYNGDTGINTLISSLNDTIFDKKQSNNNQLRNVVNGFIKAVESFVIHIEIKQNERLRQQILLSYTNRKNLFTGYRRAINTSKKLLDKSSKRGQAYHHDHFLLSYKTYFHPTNKQYNVTSSNLLQKTINQLDDYYILTILQLTCEAIARKNAFGKTYKLSFLPQVELIAEKRQHKNKAIKVYYELLKLLRKEEGLQLQEIVSYFLSNRSIFVIYEQIDILVLLSNYTTYLFSRTSNQAYLRVLDRLYDIRLEYVTDNVAFDIHLFTNIVQLKAVLGKEEDARNFIQNYQKCLPYDYVESTIQFCNAIIAFTKKDWRLTQYTFNSVHKKDASMMLKALVYQTMAMVEGEYLMINRLQRDREPILRMCQTILTKAETLNAGKKMKTCCKNFAKYLRKVLTRRNIDFDNLKKEVEKSEFIAHKNWLLNTIDAIKKGL